jgi:hypothetical protein
VGIRDHNGGRQKRLNIGADVAAVLTGADECDLAVICEACDLLRAEAGDSGGFAGGEPVLIRKILHIREDRAYLPDLSNIAYPGVSPTRYGGFA